MKLLPENIQIFTRKEAALWMVEVNPAHIPDLDSINDLLLDLDSDIFDDPETTMIAQVLNDRMELELPETNIHRDELVEWCIKWNYSTLPFAEDSEEHKERGFVEKMPIHLDIA